MAGTKKKKTKLRREFPLKTSRSYLSLSYGAVTVLVLFILVFLGLKLVTKWNSGKVTDNAANTESEKGQSKNEYTVKSGDSLWSIAENELKDGYKWTDIAKENSISNPDSIEEGQKLTLPQVSVTPTPTQEVKAEQPEGAIKADSYTVKKDDNLWEIAVRAYGDGYKWTEIAKANNLSNPDLIFSGNSLKLPR